ncbi:MAG: NAD-dependent epimerase/dehydratase family protein [Acidobacteriota bacterium]
MKGSCCLVTGGAGFIGSTIVDQLLAAGASEVRVVDNFVRGSWNNLAEASKHRGVRITEGDIRDRALVDRLTDGADYIFHQAALRITRCAEAPREALEVLVDGTFNLLEAAVKHKVKKVSAASSASVYGEPSRLPIDEDHPFNNRTMYGACKVANEQLLRSFHEMYGLDYVALRPFNVYGPRMDVTGVYTEVLIRWLDAVEAGTPPLIFGDGKQSMDFVYVGDVARAYLVAAESSVSDDFFNVGTGVQTSLNELCHMVLRLTGSPLKPEHREARKVGNVQRRRAGIEKAERVLGFRASVPLEQGLRELIGWRACEKALATAGEAA